MSNESFHRKQLFRLGLFLICTVLIFLAFSTLYSFTNTLNQLDVIESERDRWRDAATAGAKIDRGPVCYPTGPRYLRQVGGGTVHVGTPERT